MKLDSDGAVTKPDVDLEKFSWHWVRMAILKLEHHPPIHQLLPHHHPHLLLLPLPTHHHLRPRLHQRQSESSHRPTHCG
jgi:hypothetical protein